MPDNASHAAEAADEWALPARWPARAVDLFLEVINETPELAGAALGTLFQACDLIATAEALEDVAAAVGYVSKGSTGQIVAHPATVESRLARTAAAAILRGLRPDEGIRRETKARRAARVRHGTAANRAPRKRGDI